VLKREGYQDKLFDLSTSDRRILHVHARKEELISCGMFIWSLSVDYEQLYLGQGTNHLLCSKNQEIQNQT